MLGCFVEGLAAAIILIPVLHPLALQMGPDQVHFAVVVCINIIGGGVIATAYIPSLATFLPRLVLRQREATEARS